MSMSLAFDYCTYFIQAQTKHDIHSPFVFDFTVKVINKKKYDDAFAKIEQVRKNAVANKSKIEFTDFGAGATHADTAQKTISAIAKNSAKDAKYARLLYRIVNYLKPQNMLELGTSIGISTLYQALGNPQSTFITIEGDKNTAKIACQNFRMLGADNVQLLVGNFDDFLPTALIRFDTVDYVFFDGNHRAEPTLKYFEMCLQKANNNSVFVFDDINWSDEMKQAWTVIKKHNRVTVSIDLFMMGIVFFNPDFSKEDFRIRF